MVNGGKAEAIFLGNYTIHGGTANIITAKIREVMEEWGMPMNKIIGLGSDGASVKTGIRSGVGVRLKTSDCPCLVHVRCIAHRVALASQDAAKLSKCISDYRTTVNDVYKLYLYSATRYDRLKELSKVLDDTEFSSVKQPCTVRWLSLIRAVTSTRLNWSALVIEIEEEAAQRKNTVAVNLAKKLKTFSFVATTYMLSDVLPYMEKLVTVFLKDNLNLAMKQPMVESTIGCLQTLLNETGKYEIHLNENVVDGEFCGVKLMYADPRPVIGSDDNDVTAHLPVLDPDHCKRDFQQFRRAAAGLSTVTFANTCQVLINEYADIFPDLSQLATTAITILVSSVPAERGFSVQNRIHTASRIRLSQRRLNNLMILNMHAVDDEMNYARARGIFHTKKEKIVTACTLHRTKKKVLKELKPGAGKLPERMRKHRKRKKEEIEDEVPNPSPSPKKKLPVLARFRCERGKLRGIR
ncbi:zinc finger protein 862-like [Haliotis cracherodii]|uniref:zinc finger protein 862-like n=1 Tax=Haliotis cracherodii TaxID=6455 RepID=UPI0039EB2F23